MGSRRCRLIVSVLSAAFIAPFGAVEEAAADPPRWDKHRGHGKHHHYRHGHHHHRHHGHRPHYAPYPAYLAPGIYFSLPSVVIAPPPVVITPAPHVVHAAPHVRCRPWSGSVVIGGRVQPAYGTQCLMPDGSWQLVD